MKRSYIKTTGMVVVSLLAAGVFTVHADDSLNLALNQPVTYSGVEGDKKADGSWTYPQFTGEKAVDGDRSTRWSAAKQDDQWLVVDLGKIQTVSVIDVSFWAESPVYEIEVSTDGTNYHSVFDTDKGSQGETVDRKITIQPQDVRYIRYHQEKQWKHASNGKYYGASITELEAYTDVQRVKSLKFAKTEQALSVGYSTVLDYTADPDNLKPDAADLQWTSSDPAVATVDANGRVSAKKTGTTTITAAVPDSNVSASMTVKVESQRAEYVAMRQKWRERLMAHTPDLNDPNVVAYLDSLASQSQSLWETMDRSAGRTRLWEKKASDTVSADYTTTFTNIKTLTLGYYNPRSAQYKDPAVYQAIIDALNFMITDKKYNGTYSTGNWWDWQIGSAQQLDDTLILLYDELNSKDHETLVKFVQPLLGYAKDPNIQWPSYTATGANLTDISISVLASGLLLEDDSRVALVQQNLPKAMGLVTKGDGIYADGSFVQHTFFPYNGSYGNEMIKGIARVSSILVGTPWAISENQFTNVFNLIDKGFLQLMVNGRMPSMVSGRSISRAPGTNPETTELETGKETIANLTLIADAAPAELKQKIYQSVATWVNQVGPYYNYYNNPRDYAAITGLKTALANAQAQGQDVSSTNVYASMDRVMQKNPTYSVGLAMYSKRIANFEFGNTENAHAWHTADGMLYLYNGDLNQFGEGYWATVDPYRMPGTTVDTAPLAKGANSSKKSPQAWVGGATDGKLATVGMALNKVNEGQNLNARKSWFLLDGKIINLGAGINGTTSADIETIVDQRQFNPATDSLTVDGSAFTNQKNVTKWANLNASDPHNNVGYVLGADNPSVTIGQEKRSGSYKDINGYFPSDKIYTHDYFTIAAQHGADVSNGHYDYMTVPGASDEQLAALAKDPGYTVVENTNVVQAIQTKDLMMANVWTTADKLFGLVTVDNTASLMIKPLGHNQYQITLSEPRQTGEKVNMTFAYPVSLTTRAGGVTAADKTLTFETAGTAGASQTVVVTLAQPADKATLEKTIAKAEAVNTSDYTPTTVEALAKALAAAKTVAADANADEEAVSEATQKLKDALDGLVKIADTTALEDLYDKATTYEQKDWTEASWTVFAKAKQEAKELLKTEYPTQQAVDAALKSLQDGIDQLVKAETPDPEEPKPDENGQKPGENGTKPGGNGSKPDQGGQTPGNGQQKPGAGQQTPGQGTNSTLSGQQDANQSGQQKDKFPQTGNALMTGLTLLGAGLLAAMTGLLFWRKKQTK